MKKLFLLLTLSFFSAQSFAGSCPDGSEPVKSISADGTYFVYKCAADSKVSQSKTKTQSSHKLDNPRNWPSGIKYAKDVSANAILYFDEAKKPERLYINSHDRPPHNVAYQGNIETPNSYYAFWPKGAYSRMLINPEFYNDRSYYAKHGISIEKFVFEEHIDEVVDGNYDVNRGFDEENKGVFSFHLQNFHNGDKESLETLKSMMLEWVNGPYWETMIPDRELVCSTCSNLTPGWEGWGQPLMIELWNNIIPMLEVHITLIREEAYSTEEYDLVHKWLEKRVWAAEKGPGDGGLGPVHRWIPDPGAPNHHKVRKTLGYLMWGIADQNSEYYTAGIRGFEEYHKVLRNDGSIVTEHYYDEACQTGFDDHGCKYGLSQGNDTGKYMAMAAIALHNQGIDVRKKYPKIEKNIEWTTIVAVEPALAKKWIGDIFVTSQREIANPPDPSIFNEDGIDMEWTTNGAYTRKNLGHLFVWDRIFKTIYTSRLSTKLGIDHHPRRAFDFGIVDPLLITYNPDEVIHAKYNPAKGTADSDQAGFGSPKGTSFEIKWDKDITFGTANYGDYSSKSSDYALEGDTSEKFTLRPVDCSKNDCSKTQRNRKNELGDNKLKLESKSVYEWSIYTPFDKNDIYENNQRYVSFESNCGDPITFGGDRGSYYVSFADYFTIDNDWIKLVEDYEMIEEWNTFELEVLWSAVPENGYFKLKHNNELLIDYKGPTAKCDGIGFAYGLTRDNLNNQNRVTKDNSTSIYYDNVKIYR